MNCYSLIASSDGMKAPCVRHERWMYTQGWCGCLLTGLNCGAISRCRCCARVRTALPSTANQSFPSTWRESSLSPAYRTVNLGESPTTMSTERGGCGLRARGLPGDRIPVRCSREGQKHEKRRYLLQGPERGGRKRIFWGVLHSSAPLNLQNPVAPSRLLAVRNICFVGSWKSFP